MSNNSRKIEKVEELAKKIWSKYRENEKYTKEDAIVRALEILDSNGCWFDPTQEEWDDILIGI
jgi:hypothetical protein